MPKLCFRELQVLNYVYQYSVHNDWKSPLLYREDRWNHVEENQGNTFYGRSNLSDAGNGILRDNCLNGMAANDLDPSDIRPLATMW